MRNNHIVDSRIELTKSKIQGQMSEVQRRRDSIQGKIRMIQQLLPNLRAQPVDSITSQSEDSDSSTPETQMQTRVQR